MDNQKRIKPFFKSELFSWIKLIFFALLLAFLLRSFVFRPVYVEGTSMNDTLVQGDMLILNKYEYYFTEPERNDIVVIDSNINLEKSLIKRIIGLPGETVSLRGGKVYIDGVLLDEPEISKVTNPGNLGNEITLGADEYFVMGDNRTASYDSRFELVGKIKRGKILGVVTFRWWPLNKFGNIE
jgi:signal peptidase I